MLYNVILENNNGVNDTVVSSSGISFDVSSPLNDLPGTNPEELIGSSWATCLNATIKAILQSRGYANVKSRVRVHVTLEKEKIGYYFTLTAIAAIDIPDESIVESIVNSAHLRCPVSKLIRHNENVNVTIEKF